MHQGTPSTAPSASPNTVDARKRKPSTKARVVLMLDKGAEQNLRVLAAMQRLTKSSLVEALITGAVAAEQSRAGKAA